MMTKVTGEKSPSLRQWVMGAVLTVCLTVPATVFAASAVSTDTTAAKASLDMPGIIEGAECVIKTHSAVDCQDCVDGKCGIGVGALTCARNGYAVCAGTLVPATPRPIRPGFVQDSL